MKEIFQPSCFPVLIGSLPMSDHEKAADMVFAHTPEIPLWVQLPMYHEEGMIVQFMHGLPGHTVKDKKTYINTESGQFADEILRFYEDYMAVSEGQADIDSSRFVLRPDHAKGFFVYLDKINKLEKKPAALKGQITGPISFATSVKDQNGRSVFYDEQLRDTAIKILALKAKWQAKQLSQFNLPVIIFLDEPALAGFGSSEFISISKDEVRQSLEEVIEGVHSQGGLAGIHVCANTEWDLIMETSLDIVNFDAYSYFDRFILYPEVIKNFLNSGKIIAWGIVPTGSPEAIDKESVDSLAAIWENQIKAVEALGIERKMILNQSLITPSCGTGSLSLEHAVKVLELTRDLSARIREK
ncbi:UROD/MetE domain-containing protein [Desulfonema limicola]|uniref:UROD/MetE domain-containing protein n=1 Tax=Desulfonema limicola TaxID=45656 RepID=A0A975GEA4_9BACT|nr:hypothetical protein [Desulfonema limicola]QTA78012.1 UROD/MetE domain-containing protein [Desulfonema limicola]